MKKLLENVLKNVEGFLSYREARALFRFGQECTGRGAVVEIGSWKGKSTICISKGMRIFTQKVIAIDPHIGSSENQKNGPIWTFDAFKRNVAEWGVAERIVPMVMTSEEARKKISDPVEFLFIDGAHEYGFVKIDYDCWEPLLMDGGRIAFHDTQCDGVRRFVGETLPQAAMTKVDYADTLFFAKKKLRPSALDRLRTVMMLRSFDINETARKESKSRMRKKALKLWAQAVAAFARMLG